MKNKIFKLLFLSFLLSSCSDSNICEHNYKIKVKYKNGSVDTINRNIKSTYCDTALLHLELGKPVLLNDNNKLYLKNHIKRPIK
jgi:hypothetical protein